MKMKKEGEVTLDTDKHTVASISEFRDEPRIDVRHYWKDKPTQKGINLPLADAFAFLQSIVELVNECTEEEFVIVSADELE